VGPVGFHGFSSTIPQSSPFFIGFIYKPFPNGWFILIYGIVLATNLMFIAQDGIEW
jgi:hypothetical protein